MDKLAIFTGKILLKLDSNSSLLLEYDRKCLLYLGLDWHS